MLKGVNIGNGISGIFGEKNSAANGLNKQTGRRTLKELLFSPPLTIGEADTALGHVTKQFVDQQNSSNQTAAVKNSLDGNTEKTLADFFDEILKTQPLDAEKLAKKKLAVILETTKPAEQMSLADYERAKNRAIFKQAGYAMLTGDELEQALSVIKAKGSIRDGNFGLNNLRQRDKESGAVIVDVDQSTIEIARRAAQAVLQYQEYKAKQFDASQEKARSESNQMLLDPIRLAGNVPSRWAERMLNTPRDLLQQANRGDIIAGTSTAKSIGKTIAEKIVGQPVPNMPTLSESVEQLTGTKLPAIPEIEVPRPFEYQTEKYKREGRIGEDLGATAIDLFLLKWESCYCTGMTRNFEEMND